MDNLKDKEISRREKLRLEKPLVYDKVVRFKDKYERGESIAIIQFQYNYACNFKCQHCSVKGFQGRKDSPSLTLEDVRSLSRQADDMGLARFVITGGEPLIFRDFDDLVRAIDPSRFYINCDTNGWFLDKERAIHLKEIGVDRIQLSLDSLNPEEHDAFRQHQGAHQRAMAAIDAAADAGLDLYIQTVVTRDRLYSNEFREFLEYFSHRGIGVFVTFAKPVGAWEGHFDNLITPADIDYLSEMGKTYQVYTHLTPAYGLDMGCPAGKNILSVTQYGDVLPCPYFHCTMGNILKEPFKDIVARCMALKPFRSTICPLAADRAFIDKYLAPRIYGRELPVPYTEVFAEEDFE